MAVAAKLCASSSSVLQECARLTKGDMAEVLENCSSAATFLNIISDPDCVADMVSAQVCSLSVKNLVHEEKEEKTELLKLVSACGRLVQDHAAGVMQLLAQAMRCGAIESAPADSELNTLQGSPFMGLYKLQRAFQVHHAV